ncbi:MAG: histidine phosphatase family protein [Pseudomonadota bacterium]
MKSLLLLRHAEAVDLTPEVAESERPLTEFGESQARNLGAFLKTRGYAPDKIECSAAVRAVQTTELVANAAGWNTPIDSYKHLYTATAEELMRQAAKQDQSVAQLLLVAHAPGIAEAASLLVTEKAGARLIYKPCTLTEVLLDIDKWPAIASGRGALRLLMP